MLRLATHACAAALLLAAAPAQDRRALLGRVLDAAGQPLADATVTLVRSEPGAIGLVDADTVTASSDRSGWFKANLLLGALYDGWVTGPEHDGLASVSGAQRALVAGGICELRCGEPVGHPTLQVDGLAAWHARDPLTFELFADERTPLAVPLQLDQDGKAVLPILPRTRHALAVHVADGGLLAWLDFGEGGGAVQLAIEPPVGVPVQALDEAGKPVAGASIRQRVCQIAMSGPFDVFGTPQRSMWRDLGSTGAEGKLVVQVPLLGDPFGDGQKPQLVLCAGKDGYTDSHSGWMGGPFRDGLRLDDDGKVTQVEFVLHAADPAKGQLLLAPGKPLAGVHVRLTAICKVARNNGWSHLPRVFDVVTDAQGGYAVPQLPPDGYNLEILVATPAALLEPLADGRRPVRPALAPLLPQQNGHPAALPTIDLRETAEVALRVVDQTMGPARGAWGVAFALDGRQDYIPGALRPSFAVDPAGRADLRLTAGRWLICCLGQDGFESTIVETSQPEPLLTIALRPLATMQLHVVDGDGKPIAGARIERVGRQSRGRAAPDDDLLQRLQDAVEGHLQGQQRSDTEGRLLVRVLPTDDDPGMVRVVGGSSRSETLSIEPGEKVVEVVLR